MTSRGQIFWADLGARPGSGPAGRRPVLIVQANRFNVSDVHTVVVAAVTSNTALAISPGNVFLPSSATELPHDSVVNVTAITALDRRYLHGEAIATLPAPVMDEVTAGLRLVLGT